MSSTKVRAMSSRHRLYRGVSEDGKCNRNVQFALIKVRKIRQTKTKCFSSSWPPRPPDFSYRHPIVSIIMLLSHCTNRMHIILDRAHTPQIEITFSTTFSCCSDRSRSVTTIMNVNGLLPGSQDEKHPSENARVRAGSFTPSVQDATPSADRLRKLDAVLEVKPHLRPSWTDSVCESQQIVNLASGHSSKSIISI